VEQAERALRELGRFGLEYAEQPCATLAELAELRRRVDVPVAVDESIRRAEDPAAVRAAGAADIVVLKVQPLGGVGAALRVAKACGLPVVVSSAIETSVGLAAGVALAAALPELPYACGLATMSLLTGDVTASPLVAVGGVLPAARPAVDTGRLAPFQVDPAPWRDRVIAAARYLDRPLRGSLPEDAGSPRRSSPPGRATHRWRWRCGVRRPGPRSGCTCGSMSALPRSSRSAWRR
jgi:o-succinylbenzoate synthase